VRAIKTLLVANRGEIACRILRTARRLGLRTVAVFSDADAGARHVREADDAVRIGPAPARESYLDIERVLQAARATGAQAIHPGYGFLAESAELASRCERAGLVFVGPPSAAIAALGSKRLARTRARGAGIPVLPGYEGVRQEVEQLQEEARKLGFPLMIKPAAGGGGKGMYVVPDEDTLVDSLVAARRLAESAFNDGTLVLERYLPAPRHIEVQVFADAHGQILYLGDRDCSLQRRHQKVIEEAPAPGVPERLRERMREAALRLAGEVGYISAGTVEFLVEGGDCYFMEMNTRLQVEHTVTEAITGLDLVEWQLRVADGEPLPLRQEEVNTRGHAIEARVCAEDPAREFLPSAGELKLLEWPQGESLRVDAGFVTGDEVPASYDSLLGKIIAWGPTRDEAATRLAEALDQTRCAGVHTNERWLAGLLRSERFRAVEHSVAFLTENAAELARLEEPSPDSIGLAVLIAHALQPRADLDLSMPSSPWELNDGFTPNLPAIVHYIIASRGRSYTVAIRFEDGAPASLTVDAGLPLAVADLVLSAGIARVRLGERFRQARFFLEDACIHLWLRDAHHTLHIADPRMQEVAISAAKGELTTPLPGVVASVAVRVGQRVAAGEVLLTIEAMKMEHAIRAPHDGVVKVIHFLAGDRVAEGNELIELEPVAQG
jgi:3-methylcrotonyl-CoA carboxylase alpha subunit